MKRLSDKQKSMMKDGESYYVLLGSTKVPATFRNDNDMEYFELNDQPGCVNADNTDVFYSNVKTLIYTQEMKDNGELPKIGMKCKVINDSYELSDIAEQFINQEVEIKALFKGKFADLAAVEMDSGACQCFRIGMLAPLKTPEETELEGAKKKQVDDLLSKHRNVASLEVMFETMQENGHLAEIILPLKK